MLDLELLRTTVLLDRLPPAPPARVLDVGGAFGAYPRWLGEPDARWDAVLLLGPLYHLLERAERVRALAEARRVVRPGGVVLAVAISRWASMFESFFHGVLDQPGFVDVVRTDLATVYLHRPAELPGELADAGLRPDGLYAVEGMAHRMPDLATRLSDSDTPATLLEFCARTEREPETLGATAHVLAVTHREAA